MTEDDFTNCNTTHDLARLLLSQPEKQLSEDGDREEMSRGANLGDIPEGSFFEDGTLDVALTIDLTGSRWS